MCRKSFDTFRGMIHLYNRIFYLIMVANSSIKIVIPLKLYAMRNKIFTFLVVVFSATLFFGSCTKDDEPLKRGTIYDTIRTNLINNYFDTIRTTIYDTIRNIVDDIMVKYDTILTIKTDTIKIVKYDTIQVYQIKAIDTIKVAIYDTIRVTITPSTPNLQEGIYVSQLDDFMNEKLNAGITECEVVLLDKVPDFEMICSVLASNNNTKYKGIKVILNLELCTGINGIRDAALYRCNTLIAIKLPTTITSFGKSAFAKCTSLTSINIPNGVTSIGRSTFDGCTSLASINIPDGVTSIEPSTFSGCTQLASITIPDGVTSIGSSAFNGCTSLNILTIPESVTSIGYNALFGCTNLVSLIFQSVNPPVFYTSLGYYGLIYVPSSAVKTYKTAAGWDQYSSSIVGY